MMRLLAGAAVILFVIVLAVTRLGETLDEAPERHQGTVTSYQQGFDEVDAFYEYEVLQ